MQVNVKKKKNVKKSVTNIKKYKKSVFTFFFIPFFRLSYIPYEIWAFEIILNDLK